MADKGVIRVATGSGEYDVAIGRGLLETLHPRLVKAMKGRRFRPFLVTSPGIWKLWGERVRASFPEAEGPTVLFLPEGEKHKRLKTVELLAEEMAEAGADRDALLIAFGGGVVGDVTGFLAAIYMRGVPFVQVPTTFLAQVDSSVGGKTGVNLRVGKNLVGSFHQPVGVVADLDVLETLAEVELSAGLQESVKAGIIRNLKLFSYMEANKARLRGTDGDALEWVVRESVRVKAEVVAADEREGGVRMTLNFGHTIGHAIEAATGYGRLLHGQAVGWGMVAALHVGLGRGSITEEEFARMANLIMAFGPLPRFRAKAEELVRLSAGDKKVRGGRRAFVIPRGIGATEIVYDVSDAELTGATEAMLRDMRAATRGSA